MAPSERERRRAWLLFAFSFLSISLAAGLVYGWPALRQDLLQEGSTLSEKQFGAIFTAGSWSTQGGRFLTGIARDRWGTRRITCLAILTCAAGALGIALSSANNSLALGASMLFVGTGSGLQLCLQPVASLFANHTGAALSSLSGAFQVSGLVFLVLTKISDNRRHAFTGFVFFLLVMMLTAFLILPKGGSFVYEGALEDENWDLGEDDERALASEAESALGEKYKQATEPSTTVRSLEDETPLHEASPNDAAVVVVEESPCLDEEEEQSMEESPPPPPTTLRKQMLSIEYLGLTVWFSVLLVPLQYYVGSIGFQLESRGDDTGFYTDLFSILYAGSAVLAPAVGFLADKFGLGFAQGLSTMLVAISLFVLASTSISLNVHTVGLAAYGTGRMLVFGSFFTNVGKRFGYANYGTLAGLGLLTSALASLLQYPLIAHSADGHDTAVNVACGVVVVALLPYCFWLARRERLSPEAIPAN